MQGKTLLDRSSSPKLSTALAPRRVDEKYQGVGIGKALTEQIEAGLGAQLMVIGACKSCVKVCKCALVAPM